MTTPSPFDHPRYKILRDAIDYELFHLLRSYYNHGIWYLQAHADVSRDELKNRLESRLIRAPRSLWGQWEMDLGRAFYDYDEALRCQTILGESWQVGIHKDHHDDDIWHVKVILYSLQLPRV